jgi:hypothetical protein
MSGFSQSIGTRHIPTKEADGGYDGPPRFYYFNGEKGKKGAPDTPGEFYISERELKGFVPGEPWQLQTDRFKQGDRGYVCQNLPLVLICRRSRSYADIMENGKKVGREFHPFWIKKDMPQSEWPKGVTRPSNSVYTEHLCIPAGFENIDEPSLTQEAVFACKGMVGMRMQKQVIPMYEEEVLTEAQRVISKAQGRPMQGLPAWYMFRITLGPEVKEGKKGTEVVWEHLESFNIFFNLPAIIDDIDDVDEAWMESHFVGDTLLDTCETMYNQYKEWRDAARKPAVDADTFDEEAPRQESFDYDGARQKVAAGNGNGNGNGRPGAYKGKDLAAELEDDSDLEVADIPF